MGMGMGTKNSLDFLIPWRKTARVNFLKNYVN